MKHSHRVHSSKRNLSLKAKSYPVERKERNTEGQNGASNVDGRDAQVLESRRKDGGDPKSGDISTI